MIDGFEKNFPLLPDAITYEEHFIAIGIGFAIDTPANEHEESDEAIGGRCDEEHDFRIINGERVAIFVGIINLAYDNVLKCGARGHIEIKKDQCRVESLVEYENEGDHGATLIIKIDQQCIQQLIVLSISSMILTMGKILIQRVNEDIFS